VRKILGKKQPEKWAELHDGDGEWEGKGYVEVAQRNGVVNYEEVWKSIVEFGKYSFNKSHSVAYATMGFRTLFAKWLLPDEFYAAAIRNVDHNKRDVQIPLFINEAFRWGIETRPPSILESMAQCDVVGKDLLFGFSDVKNVGLDSAEYLVKLRDECGAPIETPDALFEYMEEVSKERARENKARTKAHMPKISGKSPKQMLRANQIENLVTVGCWDELDYRPHISLRTKQEAEKELLSVIVSDNVAEALANNAEEIAQCDSLAEALAPYDGDRTHKIAGVVAKVRPTKTKKNGEAMGIITLAHEGDTINFAVFPNKWSDTKFMWKERTPVIVTVKFRDNPEYGPGYSFESGKKIS
jgi:DNA polymerase III alpha subunit